MKRFEQLEHKDKIKYISLSNDFFTTNQEYEVVFTANRIITREIFIKDNENTYHAITEDYYYDNFESPLPTQSSADVEITIINNGKGREDSYVTNVHGNTQYWGSATDLLDSLCYLFDSLNVSYKVGDMDE